MKIYLAKARGFCMGVERSISMAEETRAKLTGEITILNEIVHNNSVVRELEEKGIGRTTDLDGVDQGTLIISAHGVSPNVIKRAREKGLNVVDSTCPLVTVLHKAADYFIKRDFTVIVFGNENHDEMKGVKGHNPEKVICLKKIDSLEDLPEIEGRVAFISQSTQSMEAFDRAARLVEAKYQEVRIKNTICDATRQRQTSILDLAPRMDLMIVVGSPTSANSQRLAQISQKSGTPAYLIDNAAEIKSWWLDEVEDLGITAGASTPDWVVMDVVESIRTMALSGGAATVEVFDEKYEG
ncbi:MAG: 4-hydroxy-3-methylbut-2-enyl diphosphate reductase [candidate division Zixibacteria bacterium RBG_16_53_22]|nr:MAG: 4-hydroxy-3-methylbut-2-enyl diphosphate reductase [candidate division Zixibacteria bacterium RBG_16_53_22]